MGFFVEVGGDGDLGGEVEVEVLDGVLSWGWERLVADLTRRSGSDLAVESESERDVGWWRSVWTECLRCSCRYDTEPGVALPEFEPVPDRKRDIPSAGIEGSLLKDVESWPFLKTGEAEPLGVMVAETVDIFGSALCVLRLSRRCVTLCAFGGWEYREPFWWLFSSA